jgi:hypothetical protein
MLIQISLYNVCEAAWSLWVYKAENIAKSKKWRINILQKLGKAIWR